MKTISLRKYYYPVCQKKVLVELPDEVAEAIAEAARAENASDAKQHYHCYSLDASPGIENHSAKQAPSPEDILVEEETEQEREAARALMLKRLAEAMEILTPPQARCLNARIIEEKMFKEIAAAEGISVSLATAHVRAAVIKLQKYFIKRGYMEPPKEKSICTKKSAPKRNRKKS